MRFVTQKSILNQGVFYILFYVILLLKLLAAEIWGTGEMGQKCQGDHQGSTIKAQPLLCIDVAHIYKLVGA